MNLEVEVEDVIASFSGELAISARMLDGSQELEIDSHRTLPTASVIKVPIMAAVFEGVEAGDIDLATRLSLRESEKRGGSGILKALDPGLKLTVRDVVTLMIILSDNTATNMVIDCIPGGINAVNDLMRRLSLHTIELRNRIDFEVVGDDITKLGVSSPSDMRVLMEGIANRTLLSASSCEEMERILEQQQYLNQFPRYMRVTPYWRELGQTPEVTVANKTGFFVGTRVDAGVVRFPGDSGFTYCVVNDKSEDESFLPDAEGDVATGRIGAAIISHWWPQNLGPVPISFRNPSSGEVSHEQGGRDRCACL